ncbi:receptor activity-modifying protein 2 isoform X2 [Alosa alosa]|uniref:receptor activity-modifying protein 2 isoform X2 n=1 Tax=Alosa alosa TaxID=278164 RepID=UPI00201531F2|nr:receptor activity-modifying protein 2 isoform X2 [Alosa alosa]
MPCAVRHAWKPLQTVSKSRLDFDFSVMRGTLTFLGVFLSVFFHTNGMVKSDRTTYDCGNKTTHCREYYCSVCEEFGLARSECYKALHDHVCYHPFISAMNQFNNTNLCQWHMVQEPYNTFTECTEEIADCLLIPWPNPDVEKVFVDIHTTFFQDCAVEELRDPPPSIVFALVMTPICLIPAMVILVVLKTKNGDGRS